MSCESKRIFVARKNITSVKESQPETSAIVESSTSIENSPKKNRTGMSHKQKRTCVPRKNVTKKPWSTPEQSAVLHHFDSFIRMGKVPRKQEVDEVIKKEPILQERSWKNIKDFVYNKIKKNHKDSLY